MRNRRVGLVSAIVQILRILPFLFSRLHERKLQKAKCKWMGEVRWVSLWLLLWWWGVCAIIVLGFGMIFFYWQRWKQTDKLVYVLLFIYLFFKFPFVFCHWNVIIVGFFWSTTSTLSSEQHWMSRDFTNLTEEQKKKFHDDSTNSVSCRGAAAGLSEGRSSGTPVIYSISLFNLAASSHQQIGSVPFHRRPEM